MIPSLLRMGCTQGSPFGGAPQSPAPVPGRTLLCGWADTWTPDGHRLPLEALGVESLKPHKSDCVPWKNSTWILSICRRSRAGTLKSFRVHPGDDPLQSCHLPGLRDHEAGDVVRLGLWESRPAGL